MGERRKAPRYAFGLKAQLHLPGERVGNRVMVRVISTLGCALEGRVPLNEGKKCELYFDWHNLHVGVEAVVASRDTTGRVGLKFLSVDREMQSRLKDICDELRNRALMVGVAQPSEAEVAAAESGMKSQSKEPAAAPLPVSPPKRAPKRERRKVPRYVSELPTRLFQPPSREGISVTLVVLSVLGGCVEGFSLPEPGQECELVTEWHGRELRVRCKVIWNNLGNKAGIAFQAPGEEAERTLRSVCSGLRLQPLAPIPPEP